MDSPFLTRPVPPAANVPDTGGGNGERAERGHDAERAEPGHDAKRAEPGHGAEGATGADVGGAAPVRVWPGVVLRGIGAPLRRSSAAQRGLAAAVLVITLSVGALAAIHPLPDDGPDPVPAGPVTQWGEAHPLAASSPTAPAQTPRGWRDSGRIGRWQEMGHESSSIAVERRVASAPEGILLLGDSSLTRARRGLLEALAGRPASWDQWNGRPTAATVDVAAAIDGAGRLPNTLVLLSGSNDVFFPEGFASQVHRLMTIAGPSRRVVWVAPYVRRPRFAPADEHNSRGLRADLQAAAQRHPNLRVVDWSGHVLALDETARTARMPDGAHPSALGCVELTRLIATALR